MDKSKPLILTYTLPGRRTVSSLVIACPDHGQDSPSAIRLEGSTDGGKTWFEAYKSSRLPYQVKIFKPVKVNALRLTQEGDATGDTACMRRTKEVYVYADPDASALPIFGGADSGAFSFLRNLWYAGKITLEWIPRNRNVWTSLDGGNLGAERMPDRLLWMATHPIAHDCGFGDPVEKGKRMFLRFDLDKAYPMNYGMISMLGDGNGFDSGEFYTANGRLDPNTLKGSTIQDLTGQGWILQKAWDKDRSVSKDFLFAHPGKFNQMLVVWRERRWCRIEMFGAETPDAGGVPKNPQK